MCGIVGQVNAQREPTDISRIQQLLSSTNSRGPDGHGILSGPGWSLGHNRLSIQDLSSKGHQPMRLPELGLSLVFNGEIYNFKELRTELTSHSYSFFSGSDTEVLLKGFHKWGAEVLHKLEGMFAFAIYDENTHELFLARDRLGIKPLYYTQEGPTLSFCSSLPPLLKGLKSSPQISPQGLNYYFSFHSVIPAPHTLIKDIWKLPPGHYARWRAHEDLEVAPYWNLKFERQEHQLKWGEEEWLDELEDLLKKTVRSHLIADVPVGLFLSGGLDSSLLAAFMSEAMDRPLQTFSVGFSGKSQQSGDEFPFSRQVATQLKTEHYEIAVSTQELLDHLEDCIRAQSEPMMSHDNIGFYLLSKEAARHTKVVQSGQGADEIFAGYSWYPKIHGASDAVESYAQHFFDRNFQQYASLIQPDYVKEDYALQFVQDHFARKGAQEPVEKALRIDTTVMLVDDPVKRVDNNTMAWGLEARVPFLDHKMVEFAAQMPAELKLKNGGKGLLKELGYKYLPREVIDRPKGYFPVPELRYLSGPFKTLAQEILGNKAAHERGIFQQNKIQSYLENSEENLTPLGGSKLWQVTVLEWWLQLHEIGT